MSASNLGAQPLRLQHEAAHIALWRLARGTRRFGLRPRRRQSGIWRRGRRHRGRSRPGSPRGATMTAALDRRTGLPSGNLKATQSTNRRAIQAGELQSEHGGRLHVCSKGSNHSRMIKKNRPTPLTSDNLDAKENVRLFLFSSGRGRKQTPTSPEVPSCADSSGVSLVVHKKDLPRFKKPSKRTPPDSRAWTKYNW